ncbi:MAG: class I SAM-dependent methyltransferase [Mycobacteriales bacterium]
MNALRLWDEALRGWAAPQEVLAAAPKEHHGFDVSLCNRLAAEGAGPPTPSRYRAREALPCGGTVLDVGCGVGAASLSLATHPCEGTAASHPVLGRVVGVDQQQDMLTAFAARAERLGIAHAEVQGRWPDMASNTPEADVVVCHHVLYYVDALAPFALALTAHARRRVVIEVPAEYPLAWLRPLWQRLHGLNRPDRPTIDDAVNALRELGLAVEVERWNDPSFPWRGRTSELVAHVRSRLYLSQEYDTDIAALLREFGLPRDGRPMATVWWPPTRHSVSHRRCKTRR